MSTGGAAFTRSDAHSIRDFLLRTVRQSRGVLAVVAAGSVVVLMIPELPGGGSAVLYGLWLLAVSAALLWRVVPAMLDNRHLLFARLGLRTDKAPPGYVRALFDDYAEGFDQHLMVELAYAAPNLVRGIVGGRFDGTAPVIADIGCGTGICGPLFEPIAGRLCGVDLSPAMLDRARRRNCYDELAEADLVDYMKLHPKRFDLCVAADVFVYLGDLRPALAAIRRALVPGGCLAFTAETSQDPGWTLRRTGRYAHNPEHVAALARWAGFEVIDKTRAVLRTQNDRPVEGDVWLFRRPGDDAYSRRRP